MKLRLGEIAELISGSLHGDPDVVVTGLSRIDNAGSKDLTFLLEPRFQKAVNESGAAAVVTGVMADLKKPYIYVDKPRTAMTLLLSKFAPRGTPLKGIHKTAVVDQGARVTKSTAIGPYAVIGSGSRIGARTAIGAQVYVGEDCEIGNDVVIFPQVAILDRTVIRDRAVIWSGAVIGVDGFGFSTEAGEPTRIPQIGRVVIEEDVEIFANCTVARSTMGDTVIGKNSKLDCLVHVAHNCRVGTNNLLAAATAIAGSTKLGHAVAVGGQVGFGQHLTVGDRSIIMGRSGVTKDIPPHSVVSGFPAQDHKKDLAEQASIRKIPEILERLKRLESAGTDES